MFESLFVRPDIHSLPDRSHSGNTHCFPTPRHLCENGQNEWKFAIAKIRPKLLNSLRAKKMEAAISFVKCVDPSTNKIYYFNKITHEAQWTAPVAMEVESSVKSSAILEKPYCNYVSCTYWFLPYSLQRWLQDMKNGETMN